MSLQNFIEQNKINEDLYNFKIGDKYLNKLLYDNYNKFYQQMKQEKDPNISEINLMKLLIEDIKYKFQSPVNIKEDNEKYVLDFEIIGKSNIFVNTQSKGTNTIFNLTELKSINQNDYAYIVLFFPGVINGEISNSYLLSTLLVAYLLKNRYQNYDLYKKSILGTKAKIICMTTVDTDTETVNILKLYYDEVKIVPYIAPNDCDLPEKIKLNKQHFIGIEDVSFGHLNKSHGYYKVFTKLNIFNHNIFPYKKVILLDSDQFPLGYFDTLFSLDTPAGCLEHRRSLSLNLGISSWANDRGQYCKHGKEIPKLFTDIENIYAADINASLLIIEPNRKVYKGMIKELQTPINIWFGPGKQHCGFWLGDNYYTYYTLPEQNYLTKKFSGSWKSVDIGFSTWLIDLDFSLGFTFAGFVVKPWQIQSCFHHYTINPYSIFSKINNKISQRSYGLQLLNNLLFNMLINIKEFHPIYYKIILEEFKKIKFTKIGFDPWEPEIMIDKMDYYTPETIKEDEIQSLSYDQKKIVYLVNDSIDKKIFQKALYFDYIFDNLTKHTYNLNFISMYYYLFDKLYYILEKNNLTNKLYPFGNTLMAIDKFGFFDPADDDNDFILIIKENNYRDLIMNLIEDLLNQNLQICICIRSSGKHMQIIKDEMQSSFYNKKSSYIMTFSQLKQNIDPNEIKYFNIAFYIPFLEQIIHDNNINLLPSMFLSINDNHYIKIPWIDIFYIIEKDNGTLFFDANPLKKNMNPNIFFNNNVTKKIGCVDKNINMPDIDLYLKYYYESTEKKDYYIIKSLHTGKAKDKEILFKLKMETIFERNILYELFNFINYNIKNKYYEIIEKYPHNQKFFF